MPRLLVNRYPNGFFAASRAGEYCGEFLFDDSNYSASSSPQSLTTLILKRGGSQYLPLVRGSSTFLWTPCSKVGFVGNKRLSLFSLRYGVRMKLCHLWERRAFATGPRPCSDRLVRFLDESLMLAYRSCPELAWIPLRDGAGRCNRDGQKGRASSVKWMYVN